MAPCRHFAAGKCHFGNKCNFSHDLIHPNESNGSRTSANPDTNAPAKVAEEHFEKWRYGVPVDAKALRRAHPLGKRHYTSCNHSCRRPCHGEEPCNPCLAKCTSTCIHSSCAKLCSEPCTPCAEGRCSSQYPHGACKMSCSAPCDWVPCNKRCERKLACGHQCPSLCGELCPSKEFCHICASDPVRDQCVGLITLQNYGEIEDLDREPCIVLPCGHIFTVESLDGLMGMGTHYEIDPITGQPIAIKGEMLALSHRRAKTCPSCRGSLRSVSRYGRIVRRTLLDESTTKFIAWSQSAYVPLAEQLQNEQTYLTSTAGTANLQSGLSGDSNFNRVLRSSRYKKILAIGRDIYRFASKVAKDEQPFQRVRDLVEAARRREHEDIPEFNFDETILQTRGTLLADALKRRAELIITTDIVSVWENMSAEDRSRTTVILEFSEHRKLCDGLFQAAQKSTQPLQQPEALLFWAHFAALECHMSTGEKTSYVESLKQTAHQKLDQAQALHDEFPGQTQTVAEEIGAVRKMLRDGSISAAKMHMVVAAMATEFSGTGHWYRCVNGHPFTIGECGGPMQRVSLPTV